MALSWRLPAGRRDDPQGLAHLLRLVVGDVVGNRGADRDHAHVVGHNVVQVARDTQPLVDFYRTRPTFRVVDGDQTPDAVADDIAAAVASASGAHA